MSQNERDAADRILKLNQQERWQESKAAASQMVRDHPESGAAYELLAYAHFKLGEFQDSLSNARKAVELRPRWQIASLALFHCAYRCDDLELSFDEVVRYLSIKRSRYYEKLIEEVLNELSGDDEKQDIYRMIKSKLSGLPQYADRFEDG
jgi:hypothetical protein